MVKRRKTTTSRKPIGFTKVKSQYALVFGSKTKPKLGTKRFKTKTGLKKAASKYFK